MKKLLLTAAAVSVLSGSSAYALEDTFYLKAAVGWNKLANKTSKVPTFDGKSGESIKTKYENGVHFGVAVGYRPIEAVRVDLSFDHYVNPTMKGSGTLPDELKDAQNNKYKEHVGLKLKGEINTLMLNGYYDVYSMDGLSFFVGAGLGVGQVSSKLTGTLTYRDLNGKVIDSIKVTDTRGTVTDLPGDVSKTIKAKKKTTFAFALHAGMGYEFASGVVGELAYSYRDLGKTKKIGAVDQTVHFKGHHVTAGIRFDI